MKRIIWFFLLIILVCVPIQKIEASQVISYQELLEMYKKDSRAVEKIEVQNKLDEKNYNDSIEIYLETEDGVKSLFDTITVFNTMIEQTIRQAEDADKNDTISTSIYDPSSGMMIPVNMNAKGYYLQVELPMLMNQKALVVSSYKDIIKMQLPMFMPMETLKFTLSFLDRQKKQSLISSENEFEEQCLEYALELNKKEVLELNKEILEDEIIVAKEKLELGTIKSIQLYQLENKLINLNKDILENNNSIDELYNIIKATVNIELEDKPIFDIPINTVEPIKPVDFDIFYSCVVNGNLSLKTLNHQLSLLDQMDSLAKDVYRSDEKELLLLLKNNEKERININKNISMLNTLIKKNYNDYEIAYEQYLLAITQYEIALEEYKNNSLKYELGQLSDMEYKYKKLEFMQQENAFKNAILSYKKSYNEFEEAIYGIL